MSRSPFEVAGAAESAGPFVFCCEHASNALPPELTPSADDGALLDDHWGWDIGARDVTLALVEAFGGQAVLSGFSRLVCDPNREPADPAFILTEIDGQPIGFNQAVDDTERDRRTRTLFDPYHRAIDDALERRLALDRPVRLVSIHSFTPLYLGKPRPMEIGVLFDRFDELAWRLQGALDEQGFEAALNAPYSGKPPDRLIYSAHRHGDTFEIEYLELEIRQDLIETGASARAVAERIARALSAFAP